MIDVTDLNLNLSQGSTLQFPSQNARSNPIDTFRRPDLPSDEAPLLPGSPFLRTLISAWPPGSVAPG